jgi:hypothetical protein
MSGAVTADGVQSSLRKGVISGVKGENERGESVAHILNSRSAAKLKVNSISKTLPSPKKGEF